MSGNVDRMLSELIAITAAKETNVVNVNEQDPQGLVSALKSKEGVRENRNFVSTDQRHLKRTLGVR